jgi:type I restriction enzyme S subunit
LIDDIGSIRLIQYVYGYVNLKLRDVVSNKIVDGMHNLPAGIKNNGFCPILSASNINNGFIDLNTDKYVSKEIFEKENKRTDIQMGDILLTIVATIGRVAIVNEPLNILLQRSVAVIKPNENIILSKYIKYFLETTDKQLYMLKNAHGAAQKGFYIGQVEELEIIFPSLEKQQEIVEILDKFEEYINSIDSGLKGEIELNHRRYEYWRDKLLTFKRKVV